MPTAKFLLPDDDDGPSPKLKEKQPMVI